MGFPEVTVKYTADTSQEAKMKALERAISLFKKQVERAGIIQEIRDRQYFKSDGEKRYQKRKDTIYQNKLKVAKQKAYYNNLRKS